MRTCGLFLKWWKGFSKDITNSKAHTAHQKAPESVEYREGGKYTREVFGRGEGASRRVG